MQDERILFRTTPDTRELPRLLEGRGFLVRECRSMETLCAEMAGGVGAVVLAEESLESGGVRRLSRTLSRQPPWSDVPILVLGREDSPPETGWKTLEALDPIGLASLIDRPVRPAALLNATRVALRARQRQYELRDHIEERIELEDRLRRKTRELSAADLRKEHFLAMLAHEMRTPLGAIRNAIRVLGLPDREKDADRLPWAVRTVGRQVDLMARVLDDLQDVTRISRGKIELRTQPVDLASVLSRAVDATLPLIESRGHRLVRDVAPEVPAIGADPDRLVQIVTNLLGNAARYTERGGRIELSLEARSDEMRIRVRDNGIGIPGDVLPRIFDLYKQANRSWYRSQGGLGIGLTLVRMLTELHGGRVEAASDGPGRGSEFTVRLPRHAVAPETAIPSEVEAPVVASLRILVVDDNEDSAESLRILLAARGHDVLVANEGSKALRTARREPLAVAILDLGLPGLDGFELASSIRQDHPTVALIALTGYGTEEDRRLAREAGFDHFLLKPMELRVLEEILSSIPSRPEPT